MLFSRNKSRLRKTCKRLILLISLMTLMILTAFPATRQSYSSTGLTVISQEELPLITDITPSEVSAGESGLTLAVTGTGFINESVLQINGVTRPTSYLSSTYLIAQLSASDIQVAGVFPIKIINGVTGGVSNEVPFTVNNPLAELSSISPSSAVAGSPGFTLTVTGNNFIEGVVVRWNGSDRPTSLVNSGQIIAQITATDIQTPGIASVSVFVPAPGGGVTPALDFTINNPGYEGDVAPRPNGSNNGTLSISDWVQVGRFVSGLDIPSCAEFQRADVAPKNSLGSGTITIADWVQAGRYVSGLDPVAPSGGPTCPTSTASASSLTKLRRRDAEHVK
jgi:hypothetical protein